MFRVVSQTSDNGCGIFSFIRAQLSFTKHQRTSSRHKRLNSPNGLKHTDATTHTLLHTWAKKCMHMYTCFTNVSFSLDSCHCHLRALLSMCCTFLLFDIHESVFTKSYHNFKWLQWLRLKERKVTTNAFRKIKYCSSPIIFWSKALIFQGANTVILLLNTEYAPAMGFLTHRFHWYKITLCLPFFQQWAVLKLYSVSNVKQTFLILKLK